jgi:hypothetical protein
MDGKYGGWFWYASMEFSVGLQERRWFGSGSTLLYTGSEFRRHYDMSRHVYT